MFAAGGLTYQFNNDPYAPISIRNIILHYDGITWSEMGILSWGNHQGNLKDIYGFSPTAVFAVGEQGTILNYSANSFCASVNPSSGMLGQTLDVTIAGYNTNFGPNSVVTFSCSGITVNSTEVVSSTEINANITIALDAPGSECDLEVATGSETVFCQGVFNPLPAPECIYVAPRAAQHGDTVAAVKATLDKIVIPADARVSVSFSTSDITVESTSVNGAIEVTANNVNIPSDVTPGAYDVTVSIDDVDVVCNNAFAVLSEPCIVTVSPPSVKTGLLLGRQVTFDIYGSGCIDPYDITKDDIIIEDMAVLSVTVSGYHNTVKARTRSALLGGKGVKKGKVKYGRKEYDFTLTVKGPFGR
jgi:hypothetical protein